jgi:hypothetical protein
MHASAAQAWFIAGAIPLMVAGAGHALAALFDTVRPTFFVPIDDSVRSAMEGTSFRFRRMWPRANDVTPSMWRLWLGFNISHGLGALIFGLLSLLIAAHNFTLVESIDAVLPLTIAFSAAYLALSLRFWFYVPAIVTGVATACFTVATVLSA